MGRVYDFIGNSSEGVFAVDRRQAIVLWNPACSSILGYRPEEVLSKHCYTVLGGRDGDGCVICRRRCAAIEAASRLELPSTRELAVRTKSGRAVWLDVSAIVVPSPKKEFSVLVHFFRETTHRHQFIAAVEQFTEVVSELSSPTEARGPHQLAEPESTVDLTQREKEILGFLAQGSSTKSIAGQLSISDRTVRNHVNNLLRKLGVHSRLEAVTYSIRNGLV